MDLMKKLELANLKDLIEKCAQSAHEMNRLFCNLLGDFSQPTWESAPDWQKHSALDGVWFTLNNPSAGANASHDNWMKAKLEDGWVYGPSKDPEKKTHPCLVPFYKLPRDQQAKDTIFREIVLSVYAVYAKCQD